MPLSHLFVLPCPNGKTASGAYKVSLYLAPRLRENGTLDDYPTWRNWGERVANLRFATYIGLNPVASTINVTSAAVDPNVWRAVFGQNAGHWSNVEVDAFSYIDRTTANLNGVDAADLMAKTDGIFQALARLGVDPSQSALQSTYDAADVDATVDAAQAWMDPIGDGQDPPPPKQEFHAALRYAGSHPDLLRRLGLVFDLEITYPVGVTPTEIQVRTNFPNLPPGAPVLDFTSRQQMPARTKVDGVGFPVVRLPAYRIGRWVNFGAGKFVVGQGSVQDQADAAAGLRRQLNAADPDRPAAIKATDEVGLRVVNTDVVPMLLDQFAHSTQVENEADRWLQNLPDPATGGASRPPEIYAEDISIGVRWDVKDLSKTTFRSLHRRSSADGYDFPRAPTQTIIPPADEGWSSLTVSTDGAPRFTTPAQVGSYPNGEGPSVPATRVADTTAWRVNGDFVVWSGWSLAAQHPSAVMDASGGVTVIDPKAPASGDPAQVAISYKVVPGTLERLRFSHTYQLRGRCVDLCGNSEPYTASATGSAISSPITFGRMTPIPPPSIVRRSLRPTPGVGDQSTVIVIKSELNQTDATTPAADRMLFPPRINQLRLERHGQPAADGIDIADYAFLVDRDARTLPSQLMVDPDTGEPVAGKAGASNTILPGDPKQSATYLPDPSTTAMAFHGLPRSTTSVQMATGTWPNPQSVILELKAGSKAPTTSVASRKVTAYLPKGTVVDCSVSSPVSTSWVEHFAWFSRLSAAEKTRTRAAFTRGQMSIVSPRQNVQLVHAVRIPLTPPSLGVSGASRAEIGQTTALVDTTIALHRPTSERIVLPCTWTGPDLDADPSGLTMGIVGSAILTDTIIAPGSTNSQTLSDVSLQLHDTRRHDVTMSAEAFCRFSRYFTERKSIVVVDGAQTILDARGFTTSSVSMTNAATGATVAFDATLFTWDEHAGWFTAIPGGGLSGVTLQIDYIPRPVSRVSAEAATGKTTTFTVPSSSPPPPPIVERVIPAFSRSITQTANKITVNHDGRVLRAHMTPPWNGSGDGEELGVAVKSDKAFTIWGRDPLTVGTGTNAAPTTATFTKARSRVANVDAQFDVAGHSVAYDATRDMLTSDIAVNATFAYRPFVQLHLCRYQPTAIAGAHLSTVVVSDPIRLGAKRRIDFVKLAGHQVRVAMTGPDNLNTVTVTVETADPSVADNDLKWQATGTTVTLVRSGTRAAASFNGTIALPVTTNARRLIVEDAEPVQRKVGNALVPETEVAYREVVEIPSSW